MTISRYDGRITLVNQNDKYRTVLKNRGKKFINQYSTPELRYPTMDEINKLTALPEVWRIGTRYWKLADKHYGDASLWWLISWMNRQPIEGDLTVGDVIYIYFPLESVLQYLDV